MIASRCPSLLRSASVSPASCLSPIRTSTSRVEGYLQEPFGKPVIRSQCDQIGRFVIIWATFESFLSYTWANLGDLMKLHEWSQDFYSNTWSHYSQLQTFEHKNSGLKSKFSFTVKASMLSDALHAVFIFVNTFSLIRIRVLVTWRNEKLTICICRIDLAFCRPGYRSALPRIIYNHTK